MEAQLICTIDLQPTPSQIQPMVRAALCLAKPWGLPRGASPVGLLLVAPLRPLALNLHPVKYWSRSSATTNLDRFLRSWCRLYVRGLFAIRPPGGHARGAPLHSAATAGRQGRHLRSWAAYYGPKGRHWGIGEIATPQKARCAGASAQAVRSSVLACSGTPETKGGHLLNTMAAPRPDTNPRLTNAAKSFCT